MNTKETPLTIAGVKELIYGGFWVRLGAILLDLLVLLPFTFLLLFLSNISLTFRAALLLPTFIITAWYQIYFLWKYGATPGKIWTGLIILKKDGSSIGWQDAILRNSVTFGLSLLEILISFWALSKADNDVYMSLSWTKKSDYINSLIPHYITVQISISCLWSLAEIICFFSNKRNKALHDYIADTVVLQKVYVNAMRKEMEEEDNEMKEVAMKQIILNSES